MNIAGMRTLRDLLEERVALYGDSTFLIFEDTFGATEEWSYRAFDDHVNQLANGLLNAEIGFEHRVVVHLPNCPEFLLAWFALAKIGAVMVPTNTAGTSREIAHILREADAAAVITEPRFTPVLDEAVAAAGCAPRRLLARAAKAPAGWSLLDGLREGEPKTLAEVPLSPDDLAEIIYTSGTTADPKGVMLTHAHVLWTGEQTALIARLVPGERSLTAMPCFHANAQSVSVMATMTAGATLVLLETYSARIFWRQVQSHQANVVSIISAHLRTIAAQPPQEDDAEHALRMCVYALNCTDEEKAEFEARFNVSLMNAYGLTEALTIVSVAPFAGDRRWPSVGLPAIGREIRLVGESGADVQQGEIGELWVRGDPGRTIMKGYYLNPGATEEALNEGWLRTGDYFRADRDGYLYFFDRRKDVIKRGGENISASEVEAVLLGHPDVIEAAVIGIPDPVKDETVKAFIVLRQDTSVTDDDLITYCAERLGKFKVPQEIERRQDLPKTAIGKIEKKRLR